MTSIDLNGLMNMRGAGNAQKELIKAGKWNAAAATDPDDKEFTVKLSGTATAYWSKTVKVWAKDAEEAEDKACELDIDIDDIDIFDHDDIDIDDATANPTKEGTTL